MSSSDHAGSAEAQLRKGFGPRVRKLHARIGKAHHMAEGMAFSRALLDGQATPLQLAALIRALVPAYALLEQESPVLASALGAAAIPWPDLARGSALAHDVAALSAVGPTPVSAAAAIWLEQMKALVRQPPPPFDGSRLCPLRRGSLRWSAAGGTGQCNPPAPGASLSAFLVL